MRKTLIERFVVAGFIPASYPLNPKHKILNAKEYQSTNNKISKQSEFCYLDLEI